MLFQKWFCKWFKRYCNLINKIAKFFYVFNRTSNLIDKLLWNLHTTVLYSRYQFVCFISFAPYFIYGNDRYAIIMCRILACKFWRYFFLILSSLSLINFHHHVMICYQIVLYCLDAFIFSASFSKVVRYWSDEKF